MEVEGDNTRQIGHCWPIPPTITVVAVMAQSLTKRLWRRGSTCFRFSRATGTCPIIPSRVSKQNIDPDYVGTRLKQYKYSAQIVNWWVVSGNGDTEEEVLQDLQKHFSSTKAERTKRGKKLPRPGTHAEIEFASRERVDAHPELTEDFVHRVLNLDWPGFPTSRAFGTSIARKATS